MSVKQIGAVRLQGMEEYADVVAVDMLYIIIKFTKHSLFFRVTLPLTFSEVQFSFFICYVW